VCGVTAQLHREAFVTTEDRTGATGNRTTQLADIAGVNIPAIAGDEWQIETEETLPRVISLMGDLEALLLTIKEAAVPVLTGSDPSLEAWRARRFLRLADRMLEDMHALFSGTSANT